ncbi:hypothetical protein B0H19DRAFT_1137337 [Mycena capillaripes]|nr:hypothetical protein B0H19DRAFT_1137337 [Mycena capillaripes]
MKTASLQSCVPPPRPALHNERIMRTVWPRQSAVSQSFFGSHFVNTAISLSKSVDYAAANCRISSRRHSATVCSIAQVLKR